MKRSTLILLAVAVGLGLLVYQFEYKPGKPRDEEPSSLTPAWELKAEELSTIRLERAGKETITFSRPDNEWVITQPVTTPANASVMETLVSSLTTLMIERELESSAAEGDPYELSTPSIQVEITQRDGKTRQLTLGAKDILGSSVYARVESSPKVALLSTSILTNLEKSLNEYRDRKLIGGTSGDFSRVEVMAPGSAFTLQRQEGSWTITDPSPMAADGGEVDSLLNDITFAEGVEVVSETGEDAAQFGLTQPTARFRALLNAGGERQIEIAKHGADEYFARVTGKPMVFKVAATLYEKLTTPLTKLKSRLLLQESKENLTSVQIRNSKTTLLLRRSDDGKWLIVEPTASKDKEVSPFRTIDPFEMRATEVIDRPDAAILRALANPTVEARLTLRNGPPLVIRFASAGEGNVYAQVEGRRETYQMPASILETLTFEVEEVLGAS